MTLIIFWWCGQRREGVANEEMNEFAGFENRKSPITSRKSLIGIPKWPDEPMARSKGL
jgi:hypothetical protein